MYLLHCLIYCTQQFSFCVSCKKYYEKNGSTEHSKGNKTVPGKVATTCTEDGHKQNTKTSVTI